MQADKQIGNWKSIAGLIFLLAALSSIGPFTVVTVLPSMGAIGQTFYVQPKHVQLVIAVYSVCFGLMNLLHGALSDTIGRKRVIVIALSCYTLASLGCAFAPSFEFLIAMRALQGLSGGVGAIVSKAIIGDCFSGVKAQKVMANVTMLFSLAPAVAPIIGGQLLGQIGWRAVFIFLAVFGLLLLISSWVKLSKIYVQEEKKTLNVRILFRNYRSLIEQPRFLFLSGALTFSFVGMYVFVHSAHQILVKHFQIPETQFAWLFNPLVIGIMSGAFCSGRVAQKFSVRQMAAIGYAVMLLSAMSMTVYALCFPANLWMVVVPLSCYAFGAFFIVPSMTIALINIIPDLKGTASSLQSCMQSLSAGIVSGAIVPLVWGTITGLAMTMLIVCLISLTACIAFFCFNDKEPEYIYPG